MMNCGINGTILSTELDRLRAAIPVLIKGAPQYTTEFNKNVNIGGNKILKISFFSFGTSNSSSFTHNKNLHFF